MKRALMFAVVLALLGSQPLQAQVKLRWKIADGEKTTMEVQTKLSQNLSLAGMDLKSGTEQTMVLSSVAGKRAADGTLRVTQKAESLKTELNLPGDLKLSFDSAKPDAPAPGTPVDSLLDVFKAVLKHPWTVVYGADNRVVAAEGREKALADVDETLKALVASQMSNDAHKKVMNDSMAQIPKETLKVGDTWERTQSTPLGGGQEMTFTSDYKYLGTVEEKGKTLHKIEYKSTKVSYKQDPNGNIPLKATKSDLKIKDSSGLILFDNEAGRIARSEEKVVIVGDITFEVGGQVLDSKLELSIEAATKVE